MSKVMSDNNVGIFIAGCHLVKTIIIVDTTA